MGTLLEQHYILKNIKGRKVLDYGSGDKTFLSKLINVSYNITAIDINNNSIKGIHNFINDDIVNVKDNIGKFDTIVCLSSFEHCGIEMKDYKENNEKRNYHLYISEILMDLCNRIVLTVAYGENEIYYVSSEGKENKDKSKLTDISWGYRTFNLDSIQQIFYKMKLDNYIIYEFQGGDYFRQNNWVVNNSVGRIKDRSNEYILCCTFDKIEGYEYDRQGIQEETFIEPIKEIEQEYIPKEIISKDLNKTSAINNILNKRNKFT